MAANQITLTIPPLNTDPSIGGQLVCYAPGASWQRVTFAGLVDRVAEGGGPGFLIGMGQCTIPATSAATTLTITMEFSPTGAGGPYLPSAVIWQPEPLTFDVNAIRSFDTYGDAYPPVIVKPPAAPVQPPPAPNYNGAYIGLVLYFQ